ncbi:MAG: hypothetical protein ACRDKW_06685 [Actinomycetota bacterium]
MVKVGDHVEIESERVGQPPRGGVVTGVNGNLLTIQWEDGRESSFMPKAGSLRLARHEGREAPGRN